MNAIGHIIADLLRQNWPFLLVVALLVAAWFFLRTPADHLSLDAFHQEINRGQPVVVEFFSNT